MAKTASILAYRRSLLGRLTVMGKASQGTGTGIPPTTCVCAHSQADSGQALGRARGLLLLAGFGDAVEGFQGLSDGGEMTTKPVYETIEQQNASLLAHIAKLEKALQEIVDADGAPYHLEIAKEALGKRHD